MRPYAQAAIRTRYHGPTDTKGARITASRAGDFILPAQRVTIPYPHELDRDEAHAAAAMAFLDRHTPGAVLEPQGLCFAGDYFWTWRAGQ